MKPKKPPLKTRDYLMVKIIGGATKAGVEKDHKKEEAKKLCREVVLPERMCQQCLCYYASEARSDVFCSDSCAESYDRELGGATQE